MHNRQFGSLPLLLQYSIFVLLVSLLPGLGCTGARTASESVREVDPAWVEHTLASMTLEEKAGQLIHVWFQMPYYASDAEDWLEMERLVRERKIGGFIASIGDVYEYAVQWNRIQKMAKTPLLIAADFEWGAGMRVRRSTSFPRAMAIGATRNPQYAYEAGRITAVEARALGVHQNYAPTIDVNNNPKNPVINTRAFGDDVKMVTDMSVAFVKGTQDGGAMATVKHFPGHGDTDVDTHLGLSTLNFPKGRLDSVELPPYRATFKAGVQSIMVGHLSVPAYDSVAGVPATVSPLITTRLLKEELGYEGLIVTDAMVMHGVATRYHPAEAVVLAIKAGIDLVLMPVNADLAIDALVAAVRRGEITEARLDMSVRKLLAAKQKLGLDVNPFVDIEKIPGIVNTREHQMKALEIARHAVTVLGNESGVLPFSKADTLNMADVVITDQESSNDGRSFDRELRSRRPGHVDLLRIDPASNTQEYDSVFTKASRADIIVVQLHLYTRSGAMTGFVDSTQASLVHRLATLGKPMVGISFGNPYVAMDLPRFNAYVCGYSDADVIEQAMGEVLFAEEPALGKLPVDIPGVYAYGDGVTYPKMSLRTGLPEEVNMSSEKLRAVDEIMTKAVRDSAFPGGVILAAKNGVVVYHKAFGGMDYSVYPQAVTPNTIYDLASVTKVISTTSAVMRLVDEGKVSLDDPIVKYIPQFGQRGKERVKLYNLLVHNSGLPAWRRFYEFCSDRQCVLDSVFATPLIYTPGDSMIYSDLGLITTMAVIEKVTGVSLDRFVDSVFFKPLGMRTTMYIPKERFHDRIAPTEVDTYWKKTGIAVRGRVHDENAATLGGVSGHAGLFSSASDLAVMMQMLMNGGTYGGKRYIQEATVRRFTTRQSERSSRGIGWDTKSSDRSFSGRKTSMKTFLHTGFTGTSVVADPENGMIVILLTNRVYPTRDTNKIARVRPAVHEAVYGAIKE
ncbi:MAG: hypothetical protein A3C56_05330 [Ignavibacteria bacterium RIFCSPHIGHO2_02_FULL_56_12]|nr:MAG: hypothetical protein A3C56_05330 [Ignavibacteria bacterium RIFCSPHIGHO2_02_FULL_56_12]